MNSWSALAVPLFFVGGGIGLALIFHGFPNLITINKHYHNDSKDEE